MKQMNEAAWGRLAERLARLLDGGIPLLEALEFLEQRGLRREQRPAGEIRRLALEGMSLSQVVARLDAPLVMQALVGVGEHDGDLAGSLFRTATYCAERDKWRRESRQAMLYPLLVGVVLVALAVFLFAVVIPRFADLYEGMGVKAQGATQALFAMARQGRSMGVIVVLLSLLVCAGIGWGRKWKQVERFWSHAPLLNRWLKLEQAYEWTATLGLLLDGGLPLVQALEVQEQLPLRTQNRELCGRIREQVLDGRSLGSALKQETLDAAVALSIQVAEVTGDLSRALLAAERELAQRRREWMQKGLQLIEPLLLVSAGGMVGLVTLLMLWPMLDLIHSI